MRVLLDTNIIVSYLLHPDSNTQFKLLFAAIRARSITLLLPEALLDELEQVVQKKPYLAQRIPADTLNIFTHALATVSEEIPLITQPIPAVVRDQKDDYLLAYALVGNADYLVTGDADLLVLGSVGKLTICTLTELLSKL